MKKNMEVSCNVIEDLLPLYAENMLSKDSQTLAEEHLTDCPDCLGLLQGMDKAMPAQAFDTDTTVLKKIRSRIRKKKRLAVLLGILVTFVTFYHLTAPRYLPYTEDNLTFSESADGLVFLTFKGKVTGFELNNHESGFISGQRDFTVMTYWTLLDRLVGTSREITVALNPAGEDINTVWYSTTDTSYWNTDTPIMDQPIYGPAPSGGQLSLPRLAMGYSLKLAAYAGAAGILLTLLFRKSRRFRDPLLRLALLPISYILGHLSIMGFRTMTYHFAYDFLVTIVSALAIYLLALLSVQYHQEKRDMPG